MILKYIEEKAEGLLKKHKLFKANFDIFKLAELLNIKLIEETLSEDVAGFFVITEKIPIITYHKDNSNRVRFTIAHEIGHFILHSKEQPIFVDKIPKVLFRNSVSSSGSILKEREANSFAAALLMPKELVEKEISKIPNHENDVINYISNKFGVSSQAMSFRLSNLGYDIG